MSEDAPITVPHARDAERTRDDLVRSARRRFATDGYRATTVRQIAADAGVNVALISRYFGSKEGLFAACLQRGADEMVPSVEPDGIEQIITRLVAHIVRSPDSDEPMQLLLLLRSSGDEHADRIRRETLEAFTQALAQRVGWAPGEAGADDLLLRAQIAVATLAGLVMFRAAAAVEPAASATTEDLDGPLRAAFRALLAGAAPPPPIG